MAGHKPERRGIYEHHPACFQRGCARRNVPELRGQSDGDALHARWGSPPDNSLLQHGQPAADGNGSRQGGAEGVCLFLRWCLESEEPGGGAYAEHDPPGDDDHFTEQWTWRENGKDMTETFRFARKK